MIAHQTPIGVTDADLALDAIQEVGPHGHFLGSEHTKARYRDAFYSPFLSDWCNLENWEEAGARMVEQRANTIWESILNEFQPPPIDPGAEEALLEFVAKRREAGGAPTDF